MTNLPPKLLQWAGAKPPEIRMVGTLGRSISKEYYERVYWIKTVRPADNAIIELHPLKSWYFTSDGQLIGEVDTGGWKLVVTIAVVEYVVLSVK